MARKNPFPAERATRSGALSLIRQALFDPLEACVAPVLVLDELRQRGLPDLTDVLGFSRGRGSAATPRSGLHRPLDIGR